MMHAQTYEASPTAARLAAEYKARRARLMFGRPEQPAANENAPEVTLGGKKRIPTWKEGMHLFRAHVKAHEDFMSRPMAVFIARRSAELGFSYEDMTKRGRASRKIVEARDIIAAEYKTDHPETTWTALARAFGRDHSSIFYGVHRVWAAQGNEESRRKVESRIERLRKAHAIREEKYW